MKLEEVVKGRAKKYNHYLDRRFSTKDHSCKTCLRKQFSYPWNCSDGWPCGNPKWEDKGDTCLNWTVQSNAPVD